MKKIEIKKNYNSADNTNEKFVALKKKAEEVIDKERIRKVYKRMRKELENKPLDEKKYTAQRLILEFATDAVDQFSDNGIHVSIPQITICFSDKLCRAVNLCELYYNEEYCNDTTEEMIDFVDEHIVEMIEFSKYILNVLTIPCEIQCEYVIH